MAVIGKEETWLCQVCRAPGTRTVEHRDRERIECLRCGTYIVNSRASSFLINRELSKEQRANVSGWIRENQDVELDYDKLDFLSKLRTPRLWEKAEKALRFLSRRYPEPGTQFRFSEWHRVRDMLSHIESGGRQSHGHVNDAAYCNSLSEILPLLASAWAQGSAELSFIIEGFLKDRKGYLTEKSKGVFEISAEGWEFLEDLQSNTGQSDSAFVAMWFDAKTDPLWTKAIEPGIEDAGFRALRIDRHQHNNRIDDEILAAVRKSKFIVADFTGQRGGVYFEAGFALGLRLPVVWVCKKSDLKKVHFDTRQYNFLTWRPGEWAALRKALRNRIEGTIGRGTFAPAASEEA